MRSTLRSRRGHVSARVKPALFVAIIAAAVLALVGVSFREIPAAQAVSPTVVISQIYGGAGCTSNPPCSTYNRDYIELFNRGTTEQSLNGWSVQYASNTGTSWSVTNLTNVTLQPGQYYLVAQAAGSAGTFVNTLPTADATGTVSMNGTGAKVALVNTTTMLTGQCGNGAATTLPASVVDFVGYGTTANCNDAGATTGGAGNAPAPSTTTADVRAGAGCTDTDNNSTDFTATTPNPRNTGTTFAPCAPPLPTLNINDVTMEEGNSGTKTYTFAVTLSAPAGPGGVTFDIATADNTATDADNDYEPNSATGQSIPSGSSGPYNFAVTVNGDTAIEPTETFFVNVTNVTGATAGDGQGTGTITNDDSPNLSVGDVTQAEGNAGTTTFQFTVTASSNDHNGIGFTICTADGTATDGLMADGTTPDPNEDNDYVSKCEGANIPGGQSFYNFNVSVNGDNKVEPNETFFVNITNPVGATVSDGQGQGTITNDEPTLSINDVSQDETNSGQTAFTFTVSLSSATHGGVTFNIATADGTAQDDNPTTEDNDYVANSATGVSIPNGQQSAQFTVQVNGDTTQEPNETFFVNVTSVVGASVTDGQGQGTIVSDDFTITPIFVIQGSGASSPFVGQIMTTTGIVTLLRTGSNGGAGTANGFFLQTPTTSADTDPNTSEGIFVFTSSVPTVGVGDSVRVTGTVIEFNGLTEIGSVTNISVNSTGNGLPTAVTLTTTILDPTAPPSQPQLEKYEGMRLSASSLKSVAPNDDFFDVYAVLSSVPRPFREPGMPKTAPTPPDPSQPDCCVPVWDENPERIKLDTNGRAGAPNTPYTSNVTFTNVAGPLDYAFGEYRLIPEAGPTASANMSAVPVPTPFSTEFTVAGFNIENFNNATTAGPTQRQKSALAVVRVMRLPDIIGVAEVFDLSSLQALATEINTLAVADGHQNPMYQARLIPTPVSGITQNVGYLVKTSRVRIDDVTQERTSDKYAQPGSNNTLDDTHDRPPLVLRATVEPNGANKPVIVVVNHTRSFGEVEESTNGGANARAKRKAQAESLAGLFQELQTNNPNVPVIGVGDYNAFEFNNGYDDPISVIKGNPTNEEQIVVGQSPDLVNPNLSNLIEKLPAAERYTYVFEGTPQVLDHVLANTVAASINTRVSVAHMNADFPDDPASAYRGNASIPERNSDHDSPVAYFTLFADAMAGDLLISEFRHFGPTSAEDEFVEIHNNTDVEHVVAAGDGSPGYSVSTIADQLAGTPRCVIPNGTRIPARGYFLCANSDGYSLDDGPSYPSGTSRDATPDATYTADTPPNAGFALFSTANTNNYNTDTRLDSAGPVSLENAPLYKEGAGYPDITSTARQYSFLRDLRSGRPKDTNDNASDFLYVNTEGTDEGAGGRLGAPGPQNLDSPILRNASIKSSLIDPTCSDIGIAVASTAPGASPDGTPVTGCQNTARDFTPLATQSQTSAQGTFYIRRRWRNNTGQNVTRLRFRVVDITATPEAGTADMRLLSSGAVTYTTTNGDTVTVNGLTLEEPPLQALGGGFNSSAQCCTDAPGVADSRTITLSEPLAPTHTIDVQFRFGVMQTGFYRFFVNVEAELQPVPMMSAPSKAAAPKGKR